MGNGSSIGANVYVVGVRPPNAEGSKVILERLHSMEREVADLNRAIRHLKHFLSQHSHKSGLELADGVMTARNALLELVIDHTFIQTTLYSGSGGGVNGNASPVLLEMLFSRAAREGMKQASIT